MSFADNIKMLREKKGLTQYDIGVIAGVSNKAVSTWEKGEKEPRMGAVEKLAKYFNISKSELLFGTNEEIAKSTGNDTDGLSKKQIDLIERVKACDDETITKLNQILDIVLQGK